MPALWHYSRRIHRATGRLLPVCVGKSNCQHKGFSLYHPFVAGQLEGVLILCSVLHDKLTEQQRKVQGLQAANGERSLFPVEETGFSLQGFTSAAKQGQGWSHCDHSNLCYSSHKQSVSPQGAGFCCSLSSPVTMCPPATIKAMCSSVVLCCGPTW